MFQYWLWRVSAGRARRQDLRAAHPAAWSDLQRQQTVRADVWTWLANLSIFGKSTYEITYVKWRFLIVVSNPPPPHTQKQCKRLWCTSAEGDHKGCRTQHMPLADGTECGHGMVRLSTLYKASISDVHCNPVQKHSVYCCLNLFRGVMGSVV